MLQLGVDVAQVCVLDRTRWTISDIFPASASASSAYHGGGLRRRRIARTDARDGGGGGGEEEATLSSPAWCNPVPPPYPQAWAASSCIPCR